MLSGQTEDAKRSRCAFLGPFLRVPIKHALPWVPQPTLWHPYCLACWAPSNPRLLHLLLVPSCFL